MKKNYVKEIMAKLEEISNRKGKKFKVVANLHRQQ